MIAAYKYFYLFLLLFSISKMIEIEEDFYKLTIDENLIKPGTFGEAYLTIYLKNIPESQINFDNTIIIAIDLENPDSEFSAKVHKIDSTEDQEVYKIDFTSKTEGKNNFIITLYDYDSQISFPLKPVEFEIGEKPIIIEEIIPDPSKTTLIKSPPKSIYENDTISFEFSLVDTKGNDIIGNDSFLQKLKVINNEENCEDAKISLNNDGKIFNVTMPNNYLPLLQTINVKFFGEKDNFNIFLDNLEVNVIVCPFYLNTLAICENCGNISLNESILIDIYLYNYKNIEVNTSDYSQNFEIVIDGPIDDKKFESKHYYIKKINENGNIYRIITSENDNFIHSGKYIIKIYEKDFLIKEFNYSLYPEDYDINGFMLEFVNPNFNPKKAVIDTEFGMILKGTDCFGNLVHLPIEENIIIKLVNENDKEIEFLKQLEDNENGNLKIYLTSETLGHAKLKIFYKENEIKKINKNEELPEFIFHLMQCINSILYKEELDFIFMGKDVTFYLQCLDELKNLVKRGGETFTSENYFISEGKYTSFKVKINDLQTGNYSFNFMPISEGDYYINIYLNNEIFKEINFKVEKINCKKSTPYLCPNKNLCVSNLTECIEPKNDCPSSTPFYCQVENNLKCVESQIECDCPEGYIRCNYMKYCVPKNRPDMCADFSEISEKTCQKFKQFKFLGKDGICRLFDDLSPTQKVCPIGKVLCADLSCRNNYDECAVSEYCKEGQIRCGDQSCVDDYSECPSTISCQNKKYVCPDNTCVDNEIECKGLPTCSENEPYRCQDNICVKDQNSCVKNVACGHKMALCSDLICRTTCL